MCSFTCGFFVMCAGKEKESLMTFSGFGKQSGHTDGAANAGSSFRLPASISAGMLLVCSYY